MSGCWQHQQYGRPAATPYACFCSSSKTHGDRPGHVVEPRVYIYIAARELASKRTEREREREEHIYLVLVLRQAKLRGKEKGVVWRGINLLTAAGGRETNSATWSSPPPHPNVRWWWRPPGRQSVHCCGHRVVVDEESIYLYT